MKLCDMTVKEFTNVLSSDAPAPGGGSAAALSGGIGAALTNMVCSLTIGKEKYKEHEAVITDISKKATEIKDAFIEVMDRDTETFHEMSAVFAMPKATDEEKKLRREAMQKALKSCSVPPMEMMELSLSALKITKEAIGKSNMSAASDLGVAALSLKAAIQGAWLNVLINIGGIKDEEFSANYRSKGEAILKEALPLADEIYEEIKASL